MNHVCTAVAVHNFLHDFLTNHLQDGFLSNQMNPLRVFNAVDFAEPIDEESADLCKRSSEATQALCEAALHKVSRLLTQLGTVPIVFVSMSSIRNWYHI